MLCRGAFFLRRTPSKARRFGPCQPNSALARPLFSTALARLVIRGSLLRRGVVHLHAALGLERAEHLVAADDDFVALLKALRDFDVGDAGNPGLDRAEKRLLSVDHKHALNLVLLRIAGRR